MRARFTAEYPALLKVSAERPEIQVALKREVINVDGRTQRGRIARLIAGKFFNEPKTTGDVSKELTRGGFSNTAARVGQELSDLCGMGFLIRVGTGKGTKYQSVDDMKVNIVEG